MEHEHMPTEEETLRAFDEWAERFYDNTVTCSVCGRAVRKLTPEQFHASQGRPFYCDRCVRAGNDLPACDLRDGLA